MIVKVKVRNRAGRAGWRFDTVYIQVNSREMRMYT